MIRFCIQNLNYYWLKFSVGGYENWLMIYSGTTNQFIARWLIWRWKTVNILEHFKVFTLSNALFLPLV